MFKKVTENKACMYSLYAGVSRVDDVGSTEDEVDGKLHLLPGGPAPAAAGPHARHVVGTRRLWRRLHHFPVFGHYLFTVKRKLVKPICS